ncbi:hypothetical protein KVT40_000209 [Elsinoe batatas]|uniref:Uncharacterized protein n=1 Tax=Elsinoe batatas TaxID=2601811 RepID=A0A8K0L7C3_9PEZI|nr:hypothetical protein KVT40_000209 [Elsinoe batatas]
MHIVHRGILAADLIIPHRYMRLLVFTFVNSIRKEINPSEGLTLEIFDEALLKDHMQEAWEDTQCGLGFNQQTPVTAGTAFPTIPSDLVQAYIATIAANFRDIGETDERALQGIAEGSGHFADYADLDKIISNFGIVLEAEHAHAVFSALTHRITSGVSHALRSSIQARQRQINLLEKSAAETDMDDEETETEEGATNN